MFSTQATEGQQGQHTFFTTAMRWGELVPYLVFPDDLEEQLDEDERMQRGLATSRTKKLIQYLNENDHFFSALTLIMLPRELDRPATRNGATAADELDEEPDWDFTFQRLPLPTPGRQRIGTLYLSGDVRLFPADGQHRAHSARAAIKADPDLAKEEVPVVLVPYERPGQVRQLFSDLNLNAKPVSKTVGYDMDQRDPFALLAKQVMEDVELFRGRTNRRSNSLPRSSSNVITLNTLVKCSESLAMAFAKAEGVESKPDAVEKWLAPVPRHLSEGAVAQVTEAFTAIVQGFDSYWQDVLDEIEGAAGDLRDSYVFPHGLGWQALARAAGTLIQEDVDAWESRFRRAVGALDWSRKAEVWIGSAVLLDEEGNDRINNTSPGVRDVASIIVNAAT